MSIPADIVLVAGAVKARDIVGHHDYLAGCRLAAALVEQTPGVRAIVVRDGWPEDERVFADTRALVFYSGGGDKHAFLSSPRRIEWMQRAVDAGVGLVMLHRAVRYPRTFAAQATRWTGGVHVAGASGRGHWVTTHREFPEHPVTRGVSPWTIRDGWFNAIGFIDGMRGVTPLVWAGEHHRGAASGGTPDVVAWAYERPNGGRSFCFTGLDAHSAWSVDGLRQLVVNGILWSAGVGVPAGGAPCAIEHLHIDSYLTARSPRAPKIVRRLWRRITRRAG